VAGCCEHGNELLFSLKGGEFLDQLSDCWLLSKDSAPWNWSINWRGTFFFLIWALLSWKPTQT